MGNLLIISGLTITAEASMKAEVVGTSIHDDADGGEDGAEASMSLSMFGAIACDLTSLFDQYFEVLIGGIAYVSHVHFEPTCTAMCISNRRADQSHPKTPPRGYAALRPISLTSPDCEF